MLGPVVGRLHHRRWNEYICLPTSLMRATLLLVLIRNAAVCNRLSKSARSCMASRPVCTDVICHRKRMSSAQHGDIFGTLFDASIGPDPSKEIVVGQAIVMGEQPGVNQVSENIKYLQSFSDIITTNNVKDFLKVQGNLQTTS